MHASRMNATEGNHHMALRLFRKQELQDPPGNKGILGSKPGGRQVLPDLAMSRERPGRHSSQAASQGQNGVWCNELNIQSEGRRMYFTLAYEPRALLLGVSVSSFAEWE